MFRHRQSKKQTTQLATVQGANLSPAAYLALLTEGFLIDFFHRNRATKSK